ncbi:MAG: hypothetical protein R6V02_05815 [Candidatus Aminicenantes bacterium]
MKKITFFMVLVFGFFLMVSPNPAEAQNIIPGIRLGTYTDAGDLFIGGEILIPVTERIWFNPNIEYVFVENGSYITFNADGHYDIYLADSPLFLWAGAGLGILYFDSNAGNFDSTDVGVNLLFGAGLETESRITPYIQAKVIISDSTEFVLGAGIRF